ncbi:transcriptional regulator [Peribacillus cavernae]|uniref:Transcriptional regulator n=1 Tax=Peribacillus cavernae TaxID=1674310 RepID=A0A433HHC1_9BACI|nr:transcriptional regulator [Peribacillus cavernae]MDQ0219291.1 hypothetical protein [Peribacillus cavernae]RUQ27824.1 transcriptional regulator [Peribacillus cavernae]
MNKGISYHAKDILLKSLSELYQNDSLSVLHLDDVPKIKSLLPNEYARVVADEKRSDTLFLLEDDSILMLEFESNRRYHQNYIKYLDYAHRILHRYYCDTKKVKKIRLVVVYTSDVTNVKDSLEAGDLQFQSKAVLLSEFGGDHISHQIRTKLENGEELSKEEVMKLSLLPLMNSSKDRQELIKECVELAQRIDNEEIQLQAIAGILTATDKFIDENYAKHVREWLSMTKVARIFEEEKKEALKELARSIARNFLDVHDDDEIAKRTGLTKEEVQELRKQG